MRAKSNKRNPSAKVADYIEKLMPYVPGKPIEELERELGIKNSIKIASNENPLGPSPLALKAIKKALKNLHRYPDGAGTMLKERIAKEYKIKPDMVIIGNGSNEILELLVATFMVPNDEAVMSEHAFVVYSLAVDSRGLKKVVAPPAKNFGHNLEKMLEMVNEKTRIVFIANPNNPTGTYVTRKELLNFISKVPKRVLVVIDEAYFDYVEKKDYPDGVELIKKGIKNIVAVRTFSKIYGLAGLRIGYGIAEPEIVQYVNRVRQPFNTNSLAQVAATAALDDKEHIRRSLENNREGMRYLEEEFSKIGIEYIPSVANFILFRSPIPSNELYQRLLQKGVIVRPMGGYKLPDWLRVTIGTPVENKRFISCLKEIL